MITREEQAKLQQELKEQFLTNPPSFSSIEKSANLETAAHLYHQAWLSFEERIELEQKQKASAIRKKAIEQIQSTKNNICQDLTSISNLDPSPTNNPAIIAACFALIDIYQKIDIKELIQKRSSNIINLQFIASLFSKLSLHNLNEIEQLSYTRLLSSFCGAFQSLARPSQEQQRSEFKDEANYKHSYSYFYRDIDNQITALYTKKAEQEKANEEKMLVNKLLSSFPKSTHEHKDSVPSNPVSATYTAKVPKDSAESAKIQLERALSLDKSDPSYREKFVKLLCSSLKLLTKNEEILNQFRIHFLTIVDNQSSTDESTIISAFALADINYRLYTLTNNIIYLNNAASALTLIRKNIAELTDTQIQRLKKGANGINEAYEPVYEAKDNTYKLYKNAINNDAVPCLNFIASKEALLLEMLANLNDQYDIFNREPTDIELAKCHVYYDLYCLNNDKKHLEDAQHILETLKNDYNHLTSTQQAQFNKCQRACQEAVDKSQQAIDKINFTLSVTASIEKGLKNLLKQPTLNEHSRSAANAWVEKFGDLDPGSDLHMDILRQFTYVAHTHNPVAHHIKTELLKKWNRTPGLKQDKLALSLHEIDLAMINRIKPYLRFTAPEYKDEIANYRDRIKLHSDILFRVREIKSPAISDQEQLEASKQFIYNTKDNSQVWDLHSIITIREDALDAIESKNSKEIMSNAAADNIFSLEYYFDQQIENNNIQSALCIGLKILILINEMIENSQRNTMPQDLIHLIHDKVFNLISEWNNKTLSESATEHEKDCQQFAIFARNFATATVLKELTITRFETDKQYRTDELILTFIRNIFSLDSRDMLIDFYTHGVQCAYVINPETSRADSYANLSMATIINEHNEDGKITKNLTSGLSMPQTPPVVTQAPISLDSQSPHEPKRKEVKVQPAVSKNPATPQVATLVPAATVKAAPAQASRSQAHASLATPTDPLLAKSKVDASKEPTKVTPSPLQAAASAKSETKPAPKPTPAATVAIHQAAPTQKELAIKARDEAVLAKMAANWVIPSSYNPYLPSAIPPAIEEALYYEAAAAKQAARAPLKRLTKVISVAPVAPVAPAAIQIAQASDTAQAPVVSIATSTTAVRVKRALKEKQPTGIAPSQPQPAIVTASATKTAQAPVAIKPATLSRVPVTDDPLGAIKKPAVLIAPTPAALFTPQHQADASSKLTSQQDATVAKLGKVL